MNYEGKMWRPPSERNSLILQVTVGCSHNKCEFCNMYKNKKFHIKNINRIQEDINEATLQYSDFSRVFLADGDALIMGTYDLIKILKEINEKFDYLQRVSCYATPDSINVKSIEELKKLRQNGLKMVYLGIESGSEKVLSYMKKGATPSEIVKASKKLEKAGIINSSTIILGLGGKEDSKLHARKTYSLINRIEPDYLSALTLMVKEDAPLYHDIKKGDFELLTPFEIINELYEIIKGIEVNNECIFRSNHASNYYAIKGTLPEDKDKMLKKLEYIRNNPEEYYLKSEDLRRL